MGRLWGKMSSLVIGLLLWQLLIDCNIETAQLHCVVFVREPAEANAPEERSAFVSNTLFVQNNLKVRDDVDTTGLLFCPSVLLLMATFSSD